MPELTSTASVERPVDDTTASPAAPGSGKLSTAYTGLAGASAVLLGVILFAPISSIAVGWLAIFLMLTIMMMGVPVAIAMLIVGFLGIGVVSGPRALVQTVTDAPFSAAASWSLSVLPMFILMGLVLGQSGITRHIFRAAQSWLHFVPGNLAVATNFSGAMLAGASGSGTAICYALGRVAIPEMLRANYKPSLATATVVSGGILGNLIPPSILLVIYAGVAGTPVGPQLLATVIPGILIALGYGVMIMIRVKLSPDLAPKAEVADEPWRFKFGLLKNVWPVPVIIVMVMGVIYTGAGTATEAGALGALAAVIVAFFMMRRTGGFPTTMLAAARGTASSFGAIMLLLVGVAIFTRMVTSTGLAQDVTRLIGNLGLGRVGLLFLLIGVYLVLGMFMDTVAMVLLTVPILAPTLLAADVDMIWFGIFIAIMAELGAASPPVGVLVFVVHRLAQDRDVNLGQRIPLPTVFSGAIWFIGVSLIFVVLLIFVPGLALWLPGISGAA